MKTYRRLLPYVLLVLTVVLMSGCIPKFKNPADITPPSWKVDVTVPLVKEDVNFTELISNSFQHENIIVDPQTKFYSFFKSFTEEMPLFELPDMALFTEKLEFDPEPWVSDSSLPITYTFGALPTNISIGDGETSDIVLPAPVEETISYYQLNGFYIVAPFNYARFSSSPSNLLTLTLETDEPFDEVIVTLIDRYQDENSQWVENAVASTEFVLPSLPDSTSIAQTSYTAELNLADQVIHGQLDLHIYVKAHSSIGNAWLTVATFAQLDIVELAGFVVGEGGVTFDLPEINIPPIRLLEQVPGLTSIKLKSGIIRLTQDTSASCQDHEIPFNVSLSSLTITGVDDDGNPKTINSTPDGPGSWIFDLTDLILIPESEFSAIVDLSLLPEGLVYDIYEDATGEIKPYTYDFLCSIENLVIDYVSGDISEIVADPSPETPDWDFRIANNNSGIMELDFPEGIEDFDIGLTMIDVYLELDNQTEFQGDFSITLRAYEDAAGQYLRKEASFTLDVLPRTNNIYDFTNDPVLQASMQDLLDIINSKPNYYEVVYGGGLGFDEANFKVSSDDYLSIPVARINIPIALTIGAGGAEIKGIVPETSMYDPDQIQITEMMGEFIDQASLHIKYRNTSTLGFGARFTFAAEGQEPVEIETILYNRDEDSEYIEDELVLTVNKALLDIMSTDTGYTVSADLIIPNNSTTARMMGLTDDDSLSLTVWLDGTINAHVPDQM